MLSTYDALVVETGNIMGHLPLHALVYLDTLTALSSYHDELHTTHATTTRQLLFANPAQAAVGPSFHSNCLSVLLYSGILGVYVGCSFWRRDAHLRIRTYHLPSTHAVSPMISYHTWPIWIALFLSWILCSAQYEATHHLRSMFELQLWCVWYALACQALPHNTIQAYVLVHCRQYVLRIWFVMETFAKLYDT